MIPQGQHDMTQRLGGKIAIVTGGLSGIGAAVAAKMVEEGATVIAADLAAEATTLGGESCSPLRVDVADPDSVGVLVDQVMRRHGRLDCLVNSAGIGADTPFLETTLESFDRIMAINLRGTFIVGQAAARAMRAGGGGSIVNIASVSGMVGNLGRSAYGASKGGVVTLSRVMAVDLAAMGIRVNVIAPGPVETPLVARVHTPRIRGEWVSRVPMHRYGRPEEMAGAAVFLCSDEASYVTGHVLAVDGGFLGAGLPMPEA
jgi:NAD(P)-dependent dehydrogenase (short-subunit alcohol dehydrogenase family)